MSDSRVSHSDVLGRAGLLRAWACKNLEPSPNPLSGLGLGLGLYTDIGVLGVHPAYLGIASEIRQLTASSWFLHYAKAWWAFFFSFQIQYTCFTSFEP